MTETTAPATRTYEHLDADTLEKLTAKVAKINTRAQARGFNGWFALNASPMTWTETTEVGLKVTRHGFKAELVGSAPCYDGWHFIGAVDAVEGTENAIIRMAPGSREDVASVDDVQPGVCQHCNVTRARKSVYLLLSEETAEVIQVGSTCIKDFLGWEISPCVVFQDDLERELDHLIEGSTMRAGWDIVSVVAAAQAAVQAFGWVAGSSWDGIPTRERVYDIFDGGTSKRVRETKKAVAPYLEEATALAPEILATIADEYADEAFGYRGNLRSLATPEAVVNHKSMGLAVSMVKAYADIVGARIKREAEAKARAEMPNEWLGQVGEKLTVTGTITKRDYYASDYYNRPGSWLIVMSTPKGEVSTFTSASWADTVALGNEVTVTGTIKGLDEYHGRKSTKLTRTKRA